MMSSCSCFVMMMMMMESSRGSRFMIFHSEEAPPLWLLIVVFPPRALARGLVSFHECVLVAFEVRPYAVFPLISVDLRIEAKPYFRVISVIYLI